ncbi:sirohydrochlorin cobaltochelatase [Aequitasia blattaphilus]|uniref:Sirohydrochlorin cobaltochelatase n=1 Tax=Aequitasia blattaphilus TaxID=2949332 RepID=A0ABT1E918_9FIRM|nr:sirohydrochlorin cobaltochelatase [Aequitasia blattaphilus]MCP1102176.1 sirohydrochlorin cobaltochelatase [Aequitasia blattaphilus]MCR8614816.1 sirohydrochlorin cobaltochelatase [Aequitasia blattaphilus]
MEKTKGILVVSFGTSYMETLEKTIAVIEDNIQTHFPEYKVYRAFTSQMILNKLKKRDNLHFNNVTEALEKMMEDKIERIVVQPTHILNGIENDKMIEDIKAYEERFQKISMGKPLLSDTDDYKKAIHALMAEVDLDHDEALVLMGHGTDHHANAAYPTLEYTAHLLGYKQVFVGTVEGFPDLRNAMSKLEEQRIKKVTLIPFMVVAGDHARNDMAGDEDSWKSQLEDEGYQVRTILRGLGEMKGIQNIFVEHIEEVM